MLKKKKEYKVSVLTTIISSFISAIIGIGGLCFCIFLGKEINTVLWFCVCGSSLFLVTLSVTVLSTWIPAISVYGKTMGIKKFLKTTVNSKENVVIFSTMMILFVVQIAVIILAILSLFF